MRPTVQHVSPRTLLPLVLALGCGYPSYYPRGDRYADEGVVDDELPCGAPTLEPVTVEAWVVGENELVVWERDGACTERALATLQPGEERDVASLAGMLLVARFPSGERYTWTTVPSGATTYAWEIR